MKAIRRIQALFTLAALCIGLFASFAVSADTAADGSAWDGSVGTAFDGGSGTEADPYLIGSGKTLAYLAYLVNEKKEQQRNVYFRLTADIDLGNQPWTAIGKDYDGKLGKIPFNGNFDGAGYVIRNLNAVTAENSSLAGLFGLSYTATIRNLGIESGTVTVKTVYGAGILAVAQGVADGSTLIENCYNNATVINAKTENRGGMTRMGGIVAYSVFANATVRNCVNYGTIDGSISGKSDNIMMGGVVGFAQRGILEKCVNLGVVSTGDARGGGLFGVANQVDLVVRNCSSSGLIYGNNGENALAGGFFAGRIYNATPKEISGCTVYTKGYAAYADGLITVGEQQYRLAQTVAGDCKGYETLIANVTVNETDDLPFTSAPGEKFMDATEAESYRIGSIGNGTPEEIDGVCDAAYEVSFQKHNFGSGDGGKTGWSDMRADLWLVADSQYLYLFASVSDTDPVAGDRITLTVTLDDGTLQFGISQDGTLTCSDESLIDDVLVAVVETGSGWNVEAALPLSLMGVDAVGLTLTMTDASAESAATYTETLTEVPVRDIQGKAEVRVTGIELDRTKLDLKTGESATLKAKVTPFDAYDSRVEWSSSDTTVLSVSDRGEVKASKPGHATITAKTVDGGFEATCEVTVTPIEVTGVTLNLSELTLEIGKKKLLICTVSPENADNRNVTWSSDNEAVATVTANGLVTAQGGGEANITVTAEDGSFTAVCKVTVKVTLTGLTFAKPSVSMKVGDKKTVEVTKKPVDATDMLVWSSDNTDVVTVSENGEITAVAAGTATVTVKNADGSLSATLTVSVESNAESGTEAETGSGTEEKSGGCSSSVGFGIPGMLILLSLGVIPVKKKRAKK